MNNFDLQRLWQEKELYVKQLKNTWEENQSIENETDCHLIATLYYVGRNYGEKSEKLPNDQETAKTLFWKECAAQWNDLSLNPHKIKLTISKNSFKLSMGKAIELCEKYNY